jgi:hypothetical protein
MSRVPRKSLFSDYTTSLYTIVAINCNGPGGGVTGGFDSIVFASRVSATVIQTDLELEAESTSEAAGVEFTTGAAFLDGRYFCIDHRNTDPLCQLWETFTMSTNCALELAERLLLKGKRNPRAKWHIQLWNRQGPFDGLAEKYQ